MGACRGKPNVACYQTTMARSITRRKTRLVARPLQACLAWCRWWGNLNKPSHPPSGLWPDLCAAEMERKFGRPNRTASRRKSRYSSPSYRRRKNGIVLSGKPGGPKAQPMARCLRQKVRCLAESVWTVRRQSWRKLPTRWTRRHRGLRAAEHDTPERVRGLAAGCALTSAMRHAPFGPARTGCARPKCAACAELDTWKVLCNRATPATTRAWLLKEGCSSMPS
jgi:hypothetical protein